MYDGYQLTRFRQMERIWNADVRLAEMDEVGIDRKIINLPGPRLWLDIEVDDALEFTRLGNDEIRLFAERHPDRFIPAGTIACLTGSSVDEFHRCVKELDFAGVQIFSNIGGRPLEYPDFRVFFARANYVGCPLWIHPQLIESYD